MTRSLGKILSSASHHRYFARVFDASDCASPPGQADITLGRLLIVESTQSDLLGQAGSSAPSSPVIRLVALLADTSLINPDASNSGPRLTIPHEQNFIFAPDYINEIGILIEILLLGQITPSHGSQGIPPWVLPVGSLVRLMEPDEIRLFHRDPQGRFQMRYFPLLSGLVPAFASSLFRRLCDQIEPLISPSERRALSVIQRHFSNQALGSLRV